MDGLRMAPVLRYQNYLVFYTVSGEQIVIRRILHAARDVERILREP
jgi:plasmid stabilization system protein ParE